MATGDKQDKEKEVDLTKTKVSTTSTSSSKEGEDKGTFEATSTSRKQLEPGQKQPAHKSGNELLEEGADKIIEVTKQFESEAKKPHSERTGGDNNPTPAHERDMTTHGPAATAALDSVAQATRAAIEGVRLHEESEARLKSDPRWERDQRVYEAAKAGTLGSVPPSEEEVAALAARAGASEEEIEAMPKSPEEQVEKDMARLDAAKQRTATGTTAAPSTGKTETSPTKPVKSAQENESAPRTTNAPKDTKSPSAATSATEKK